MRRIALTGGIATGKSHVRARLARAAIPTLDADHLARDAVAPGTPALDAIRRRFGDGIIDARGALDRQALAGLVFADPEARRALEHIVHPVVRTRTEAWLRDQASHGAEVAVVDIPLLYETGRDADFDAVIVTACTPDQQVARLLARNGLDEPQARARLAAQWPTEEKVARATYVIRTDGRVEDTDAQVDALIERLRAGG